MKYSVVTFGCRVNQADSLGLEAGLCQRGDRHTTPDAADVIVVNTCSVTASADQGARQVVRRLHRLNPAARIVVTGCYATRASQEIGGLPGVVRVVTNDRKDRLLEEIDTIPGVTARDRLGKGEGACGAPVAPGIAGRTAWTLRVQTGCAERCSYCVIPATRGPSRSRALADVLDEMDRAAAWGFREMAITGVHLGSYGRDLEPAIDLTSLLRALSARAWRGRRSGGPRDTPTARSTSNHAAAGRWPPLRLRVSSLEPMDCPDALVDLVAADPVFAPHFHLPLQHASERLLAAMRRPYTLDQYRGLVGRIRERLPHASIGTDVIAGFPGETDDDAATLARYLESSPITHVHVFPYSDRPGTEASGLEGKVPGAIVRARSERLRTIGRELTRRFHETQIGTVRPGLTLEDGTLAVTDNYLKVRIPRGRVRNEWVDLRIDTATPDLHGEVLDQRDS